MKNIYKILAYHDTQPLELALSGWLLFVNPTMLWSVSQTCHLPQRFYVASAVSTFVGGCFLYGLIQGSLNARLKASHFHWVGSLYVGWAIISCSADMTAPVVASFLVQFASSLFIFLRLSAEYHHKAARRKRILA